MRNLLSVVKSPKFLVPAVVVVAVGVVVAVKHRDSLPFLSKAAEGEEIPEAVVEMVQELVMGDKK